MDNRINSYISKLENGIDCLNVAKRLGYSSDYIEKFVERKLLQQS